MAVIADRYPTTPNWPSVYINWILGRLKQVRLLFFFSFGKEK
jgi:hypothetical protein